MKEVVQFSELLAARGIEPIDYRDDPVNALGVALNTTAQFGFASVPGCLAVSEVDIERFTEARRGALRFGVYDLHEYEIYEEAAELAACLAGYVTTNEVDDGLPDIGHEKFESAESGSLPYHYDGSFPRHHFSSEEPSGVRIVNQAEGSANGVMFLLNNGYSKRTGRVDDNEVRVAVGYDAGAMMVAQSWRHGMRVRLGGGDLAYIQSPIHRSMPPRGPREYRSIVAFDFVLPNFEAFNVQAEKSVIRSV